MEEEEEKSLDFHWGLTSPAAPKKKKKADVKENDSSLLIKTSVGISLTPVAKH